LVYPSRRRDREPVEADVDSDVEEPIGASQEAADVEPSEFFFAKVIHPWKRGLDVVGSTIGLVLSAPIVFVAALAIKASSPGPAFFVQQRVGRGGKPFYIWKLRTMCVDAEIQKDELRPLSQQDGPAFKMKRDPRTTKIGRFLRWSSIDEMPQFWNVLKGDMSLVGPRPLPTAESEACDQWHRRRLDVLPGITCTWQVFGRGKVRFDDWVRMDLQYAARPSVVADLKLMCVTIPSLLFQRGMR
jgi:lipopolysaccharide/colanic/teichoic acid biosynthesis glycosyltransferase